MKIKQKTVVPHTILTFVTAIKESSKQITEITGSYPIRNKVVNIEAFDIKFVSNISFPDHIGIGKNVSINCGIVMNMSIQKQIRDSLAVTKFGACYLFKYIFS